MQIIMVVSYLGNIFDTEKVYQGFRDLVLYRYCNIPCDNNIVLDSSIIFDNKRIPIAIMNDDRPIHFILYRLGLGYWDAGTVCSYINRNGYNNLKDVNLRTVFNDILSNKFSFEKDSNKIGLMLKRKIHLILESSDKFKENISNNSYWKR